MAQLQRLAIIVSCTARKASAPAPSLQARNHAATSARSRSWIRAVEAADHTQKLRGLYQGQQWQSSLALEGAAQSAGYGVDLYVASAGLGLRPVASRAPSYSASFSTGPDNVAVDVSEARDWWRDLEALAGTTTLTAITGASDQLLIAMSPVYARVLLPEIAALPPDTTALVSSAELYEGAYLSTGLRGHLGGSALTLNQRAAATLLKLARQDALGSEAVRARWHDWAQQRRTAEPPDGKRVTDETVREFIRLQMSDTAWSRTQLLRQLRAAGCACEQTRFAQLYTSVLKECA